MRKPQHPTGRRVAFGAVAVGVAVTVPVGFVLADESGGGTAAAECHLTQLELPDDVTEGAAEAVSNENAYVAGGHEWLWHDEYLTIMEGVQGDVGNEVAAVNSDGIATGTSDGESDYGAWTYQDGEVTHLLEPGGDASAITHANDINDDGTVVGYFAAIDSSDGDTPAKWEAGSDKATALAVEDGKWGEANAISADGTVVGTMYESNDDPEVPFHKQRPWLWSPGGEGRELPLPPDAERGRALSISGDWVLMSDMATKPTFYRWNKATDGEPEALTLATATDIDSRGRAFGAVDRKVAGFEDADGVTKLPNVTGKTGGRVRAATDDGRLMAGVSGKKPVIWFCG